MLSKVRFIRPLVLLAGVSIPLVSGCSYVQWERDYNTGLKKAAEQRRRAVIQFYSMNKDCYEMDREVFSDSDVQELMK